MAINNINDGFNDNLNDSLDISRNLVDTAKQLVKLYSTAGDSLNTHFSNASSTLSTELSKMLASSKQFEMYEVKRNAAIILRQRLERESNIMVEARLKIQDRNLKLTKADIDGARSLLVIKEAEYRASRRNATLNAADREDLQEEVNNQNIILQALIDRGEAEVTSIQHSEDLEASIRNQISYLDEYNTQWREVTTRLGVFGGILKGLGRIPIIGDAFRITENLEESKRLMATGQGMLKSLWGGFGESLKKALPLVGAKIAWEIGQAGLAADADVTKLARSLVMAKEETWVLRDGFTAMAANTGDNFMVTEKLVKSNMALSKQLGFSKVFTSDMNVEFVNLTEKIGVSEESAGGLAQAMLATGGTLKSVKEDTAEITQNISSQYGIQLNTVDVLNEVGDKAATMLTTFKGNPKALAEAVAQAKALGTSLDQTQKQAEHLLDFQSSIESQLNASLLIGRNINLDKARELALNNDLAGLAKEMTNQSMDFFSYSNLNVVQQKAMASALGLSKEELSDQLLKLEAQSKSREEIMRLGGKEAADRLQQLSAQDKFNAAVEKLKDIFVRLIDGPVGHFLDMLVDALDVVGKLSNKMSVFSSSSGGKMLGTVAGMAGTGALLGSAIPVVGTAIGGIAGGALGLTMGAMYPGDDVYSGYGDRSLVTSSGTYALNNNDTVIAGTSLFKGDDVISYPKDKISLGGKGDNMGELVAIMKEVKTAINLLASKETVLNIDSQRLAVAQLKNNTKTS